jgi:hypothetical protein
MADEPAAPEPQRQMPADLVAQSVEFAETRAQALEAGAESLRAAGEFFTSLAKMARAEAAMIRQAQSFQEAMRAWTPPLPPFPALPPAAAPAEAGTPGPAPLSPFMDPTIWFAPWLELYRPRERE